MGNSGYRGRSRVSIRVRGSSRGRSNSRGRGSSGSRVSSRGIGVRRVGVVIGVR